MDSATFDQQMRAREEFHGLRVNPERWIVVRVDGRGFSKLTARRGYKKPFDPEFSEVMVQVAHELVVGFGGAYGYTESDEVSVVLPPRWNEFGRSVEKTVSLTAAIASSVASLELGEAVTFDSRLWVGDGSEDVVDYLSWRQADARRCALNGLVYWTLREQGMSGRQATALMRGQDPFTVLTDGANAFLDMPTWMRHGVGLRWETRSGWGTNPKTGEMRPVQRWALEENRELPRGDEYREMVRDLLTLDPT